MDVQEILAGKKQVIDFLKEKGFQREEYFDEDYKDGTYFKIDKRKLLVVYEISDEEKLKEIKDHFLIDRGLCYCIIIFNDKIIFFRNFGETKYFIYSERTKTNVFKKDKLNRIKESLDVIFQTEDNSGKFYEAFKLKRNILVQNIKNDVAPVQKYLIAQKVFDRFFFIYFLCHKGIIKFKDGRKISGETLFRKILLKKGGFLQNIKNMFHLFNSQGKNVLEIGDYQISIPYLNGGLFRPDILEQDLDIRLKDSQWEEIFEFLNSYHWIIEDVKATEENEEKILTPEILGHIYERSVVEWERVGFKKEAEDVVSKKTTERKLKGVFYTPEEITEFISKSTILPVLFERLGKNQTSFDDFVDSSTKEESKQALDILNKITIVDPACGSGAFLVKAAELLFYYKRRLHYKLEKKIDNYEIKFDIITNNIYGIDILAGASEISKLRLWLWLISETPILKEIDPLPNIEYNLRVGNSLIGWLDENLSQISLKSPLTDEINGIFTGLIAFSSNDEIESLKKARELLKKYSLEDYIEAYYLVYKIYRSTHGLKAENLREILEKLRKSIYSSVNKSYFNYLNKKIDPNHDIKNLPISIKEFENLSVFHWKVDFGHIINSGGFDIVLENPPYVHQRGTKDNPSISYLDRKIYRSLYYCADSSLTSTKGGIKLNTFMMFTERSIKLLNQKGYFSQIVHKNILKVESYKLVRKYILENSIIKSILDVKSAFEQVTGEMCIITLRKEIDKLKRDNNIVLAVPDIFSRNEFINETYDIKKIPQKIFWEQQDYVFPLFLDIELLAIKETLQRDSKPLKELCNIICFGLNLPTQFIKSEKINNSYVPAVRGKDIEKWRVKNIRWIPYDDKILTRKGDQKAFLSKEKIILQRVGSNVTAVYDDKQLYTFNTVNMLIPKSKNVKLKYILGLLNSKLLDGYIKLFYILKSSFTVSLTQGYLENLPIKIFNEEAVVKLVDKIIKTKQENKSVAQLEEELNKMVYDGYGLNRKEIERFKNELNTAGEFRKIRKL